MNIAKHKIKYKQRCSILNNKVLNQMGHSNSQQSNQFFSTISLMSKPMLLILFYYNFYLTIIQKPTMRANRKKKEKKNIFDEDEENTQSPNEQIEKNVENGARYSGKKNDFYEAAKIEENQHYIGKKQKMEENLEYTKTEANTKKGAAGKKKLLKKKPNVFESDDSDKEQSAKQVEKKKQNQTPESNEQEEQMPQPANIKLAKMPKKEESETEDIEYQQKIKHMAEEEKKKSASDEEAGKEFKSFSELFQEIGNDRDEQKAILLEPIPPGYKAVCIFKRIPNGFSEYYQLLFSNQRSVIFCENQRGSIGANYYMSLTKEMDKLSSCYLGKLRGNAAGSIYNLYDGGNPPGKNLDRKQWRTSLAKIDYETNFLGMNGPRKIRIIIPNAKSKEDFDSFKLTEEEDLSNFEPPIVKYLLMIFRKLRNKQPKWNERLKSYALNFGGRVKLASIKNFILVDDAVSNDEEFTAQNLLVFGKIDDNNFSLEATAPLSLFQAFGIVMSEFDFKLNCE